MPRLFSLTPRQYLIVAHDLLATVLAIVASFFIRFEDTGLAERFDGLIRFLPGFVVYAGLIYFLFGLHTSKWRFTSLPDLFNIVRAATVLALSLLVLDYILVSPQVYGQYFFGKITIVLYWFLQVAFLAGSRVVYRQFRYVRTQQLVRGEHSVPTLVLGRAAAAEVWWRGLQGGEAVQLAPVAVEDLLLRPSVTIDYRRLENVVRSKSIIVTGGGGSIGAEICDRMVTFGAARLLVVEHSEVALHTIVEALRAKS